MEIRVNKNSRAVEIWLCGAEAHDETLRNALSPVFSACRSAGCAAAVFISGEGALAADIEALVRGRL